MQEGDVVEKGQVLAQLSSASRQEDMARLEYQIARNQIQMDYSQINEDYEISSLWLNYMYQSGQSREDRERLEEAVAQVQQNYSYAREDYQDAMNLDLLQLEQIRQEETASRLVAGMAGTVSHIKENLEGSTSVRGEGVITIIDGSECLFMTEAAEYASCFREGRKSIWRSLPDPARESIPCSLMRWNSGGSSSCSPWLTAGRMPSLKWGPWAPLWRWWTVEARCCAYPPQRYTARRAEIMSMCWGTIRCVR